MPEDTRAAVPYTLGEQVTIAGDAAQASAGADHGVIVGDTGSRPDTDEVKVIVTPDSTAQPTPNAVMSPTDLRHDPDMGN